MSENEIKENNKLIAKFMDIEFNKDMDKCNHPLIKAPWPPVECLQYHQSWSWIMPVVEKIESLKSEISSLDVQICVNHTAILVESSPIYCCVRQFSNLRKIDTVYLLVVEFLKWYNAKSFS